MCGLFTIFYKSKTELEDDKIALTMKAAKDMICSAE